MAFAGLWERWTSPEGEAHDSCAILTTSSSRDLEWLHDRMPVILSGDGIEQWLRTNRGDQAETLSLLRPYNGKLEAYTVSPLVNSPRNNSPQCIKPAAATDDDLLPGLSR